MFAVFLGLWNLSVTSGLRDRGVETTGVTFEGPVDREGHPTWRIEYVGAAGEEVRCAAMAGVPPGAGNAWRIRYDPSRPTRCVFANDPLNPGGPIALAVVGLAAVIVGGGWMVVWLRPVARAGGGSRKGR
ncbi:hypothetical protein R8Z50_35070 [Longispora sp. K20-0274]|uniref:DUF3592 domain-containing protein n=1 Tax=Longispora sp. K20-0274 TaxID=3088255 RepID=UPI00399B2324